MLAIHSLSATLLFFSFARAIEVTSNSPCYSTCGGGLTFGTDLTCNDDGYNNTDVGRKMDACLTCEGTSTASLPSDGNDTAKNDLYWFLFNMKYTLEVCLFGNTTDTSGMPACDTACNPLQTVLDTSWFTTPMAAQYDYCDIDSGSFPANADTCASCLQGKPGSVVLGNFLETMNAACSSKPNATLGQTLSLPVSLFDVDVSSSSLPSSSSSSSTSTASASSSSSTSPPPAATSSTSTSTSIPSASPSSGSQTSNPSKSTSSGLSTGASIGIGVGIGIAALATLAALLAWCLMRRRKRRNENQHPETFKTSHGENKHDTRPPTYVGAPPPASELPGKQGTFPEEMEGDSSPGYGTHTGRRGGGSHGRSELANNVPPAELGA